MGVNLAATTQGETDMNSSTQAYELLTVGVGQLATGMAADVLVVGSRGHGRLRRALLGSISSHVAHNAPCPVMIVRADS